MTLHKLLQNPQLCFSRISRKFEAVVCSLAKTFVDLCEHLRVFRLSQKHQMPRIILILWTMCSTQHLLRIYEEIQPSRVLYKRVLQDFTPLRPCSFRKRIILNLVINFDSEGSRPDWKQHASSIATPTLLLLPRLQLHRPRFLQIQALFEQILPLRCILA